MSGFSNPIIGGGGSLVYPSIHSPDFGTGDTYPETYTDSYGMLTGWSIDRNGNAFFASLTLGNPSTFTGTDFVINQSGAFFYSGPAAAGNLAASIANNDGTDAYGNAYLHGMITYMTAGGVAVAQGCQDGATLFATAASQAGPYTAASGQLRSIGTLNAGWTAGTDVNGTSDPPIVTQTDAGTIVMAGRLVTPATGTIDPTVPFGTLAAPFVLPASGAVVPEFPTSNAGGGQTGSVILRPNGNLALNGNFANSTTILTAGAFRF